MRLQLTKHHGLGNDFLVALDQRVDGGTARALCDRHTGVGADGLIAATRDPLTMVLYNADGGRAEMSGNGIRCLAQAVVDAGWAAEGDVKIATDAGIKVVQVGPERAPGLRQVSVDMGPAVGEDMGGRPRRARVRVGNPHEVWLTGDVGSVRREDRPPSVNEEYIAPGPEPDAITMRVWERGVGETLACGTGACAAAWAAHEWGLVGTTVTVHQLGGDAIVELKPETIILTGPTQLIAKVDV